MGALDLTSKSFKKSRLPLLANASHPPMTNESRIRIDSTSAIHRSRAVHRTEGSRLLLLRNLRICSDAMFFSVDNRSENRVFAFRSRTAIKERMASKPLRAPKVKETIGALCESSIKSGR